MYKRNYKNRPRKMFSRKDPTNMVGIESQKDAGMPYKEASGTARGYLFNKTTKGLPRPGSSITVKADPYALVLPDSDPYSLVNSPNSKVGGSYGGVENLDGGVTNQIISSELSSFLHTFDSMLLRCRVNYRYLPVDPTDTKRGKGFVREMEQAIDEVISIAKSTTYTQLGINQYYIKTDLPIYDSDDDSFTSNLEKEYSCGDPAGLYAILICYQTYLQAFAQVFNAYNKFRANQGLMKRSSWNRETARLNSYFSLMNKNSIIGQFKSLAYVLNGEYFDQEWMKQFNMIGSLISRKSDAMVDPIKEITCTHNIPKFKIYTKTTTKTVNGEESVEATIFDSTVLDNLVKNNLNPTIAGLNTFADALDYFSFKLSVNDTLFYVRNDTVYSLTTEASRMNALSDFISLLINAAGLFKPAMGDLRTMLDVVQRTGSNAWVKSTTLEVFDSLTSPSLQNMTVDNIYQSLMSGADEVLWDTSTLRWRYYTIWDYYYGIPEYDAKSGGCFLTFSTKSIESAASYPAAGDYLPVFIHSFLSASDASRSGSIYAINRLGSSYTLSIKRFDPKINPSSARLAPLTTSSFKIRVPGLTSAKPSTLDLSFLQAACLKAFGSFSNSADEVTETTDLTVNPDQLCLIPIEIEDLTNEMIKYARCKGPFVVNFDSQPNIGFLGLTR